MSKKLSGDIAAVLEARDGADAALTALMKVLGRLLNCDRCLLFLRNPQSRLSRMSHGWTRKPEYRLNREECGWVAESPTLERDDPMFALALRDPQALFIDDVLSAESTIVNGPYEVENFGHRALVHAPLYYEGLMYGILEPCVFGQPRPWSTADRILVRGVQDRVAELSASYVRDQCPNVGGIY